MAAAKKDDEKVGPTDRSRVQDGVTKQSDVKPEDENAFGSPAAATRAGEAPDGPKAPKAAVAKKVDELRANVEAGQIAASQSDVELRGERPARLSHQLPDEAEVNVLGGYPVPAGAEKDAVVNRDRKFYTAPAYDADEVQITEGEPVDGDVWEAVYQNNAKKPTFKLVAARGQILTLDQGDYRLNDFG